MVYPVLRSGGLPALVVALAIGAAGGLLFTALGLPAAWMSGAMVAVALAALSGLAAPVPPLLRSMVFVILGLSMGSGVTPDLIDHVADWPASLIGLAVTVAATTTVSYLWLRRIAGWDPATAYFGAIPGALTMTLATAETSRADLVRVSLSQTMRLLMLVAVLPLVVTALQDVPPGGSIGTIGGLGPLLLLVTAGSAGALVAHVAGVPAGLLIGAFVVSGLLHGFDLVSGQLPAILTTPAFVALGCFLGLRFSGTGWRLVGATLIAGLGAFLVALAVSALGALVVAELLGLPIGQVIVAFAPGGLEVMVILAFLLKVDPAYVAAHHLARFIAMTILVPFLARAVLGPGWTRKTSDQ